MSPLPCSRMIGSAAWVQYRSPSRLTSTIRRQSSGSPLSTGPSSITPALLISDVEAPEALGRARDEGARLGLVGDVDLERDGGRAGLVLDPLRERLDAVAAARAERDGRAGAGERERGRLADPRRRARDRHRLAAEVRHAARDAYSSAGTRAAAAASDEG